MNAMQLQESLTCKIYRGKEVQQVIGELASLRLGVFREYPYLYDGNLDEELEYLSRYVELKDSFVYMIFDKGAAVGATTATPLIEEYEKFQEPYANVGINPNDVFYFGEAMLLPDYRGMGLYKNFMQERQSVARQYGAKLCSFLSVKRPENHPLRPKDYQDLKSIWTYYGFVEHPEIAPSFAWQDVLQAEKTEKTFSAWLKAI